MADCPPCVLCRAWSCVSCPLSIAQARGNEKTNRSAALHAVDLHGKGLVAGHPAALRGGGDKAQARIERFGRRVAGKDLDAPDAREALQGVLGERAADALVPSTLEGCLVRVCDIVAYLGKDRQDAAKAHVLDGMDVFDRGDMGRENAEIINNLTVSIIEHSYSRDCIEMDDEIFSELQRAKRQNYQYIYRSSKVEQLYSASIRPMMRELYDELYRQAADRDRSSVLWRHHIEHINEQRAHYTDADYSLEDPHQIVTDYIASMTDDYFIALHRYLFPKSPYEIKYKSYFDDL